jgi:hypothetical protein
LRLISSTYNVSWHSPSQLEIALTHHALGSRSRTFIPQQEPSARLEQIRHVFDIRLEVVQEHLEDMKDGIRASDLELGQFAVKAHILRELALP